MTDNITQKKVLIIYSEPTLLTTDSVDPNVITLLIGVQGGINLSFLLRGNAVEYLVSSNWMNDFPESESNASWEWISKQVSGKEHAIREDIENLNLSITNLDKGIVLISNDELSSLIENNDVIFIY